MRMLYLLQLSNQIPIERQVIETGVKYPIRLHRRKTPYDWLKVYEDIQKRGEIQVCSLGLYS